MTHIKRINEMAARGGWTVGQYKVMLGDVTYSFDPTYSPQRTTYNPNPKQVYILNGKHPVWKGCTYWNVGLECEGLRFDTLDDAKNEIEINKAKTDKFLDYTLTKHSARNYVYVIYVLKEKPDIYHKTIEVVEVIPFEYSTVSEFEKENGLKIDDYIKRVLHF